MKVVITNALTTGAVGDRALLARLLELLWHRRFKVEAITDNPAAEHQRLSGVAFHQTPGSADGTPAFLRPVIGRWRLAVTRLSARLPSAQRLLPRNQRNAVAALRTADLVIACPGSYLANPGLSLDLQLAQLLVAASVRAPLVMAPMSIADPPDPGQRRRLQRVLRKARQVFVRESASEATCKDLGASASLSNDIGFLDDGFTSGGSTARQPRHVAVTVVQPGGEGQQREAATRRCLDTMVSAVGAVARHTHLPVVLIIQSEHDRHTVRQLANALSVPTQTVDVTGSPAGLQALLPDSYCLVASRFDGVIQALAAGCPVAALTRTAGQRSMLHLYGLDDIGLPLESFDAETLSAQLIRWGDDRTGFRQRCASLRDSLRRVGDPFVDCLASVTVPDDE